jgi:HlyD family secretion protein
VAGVVLVLAVGGLVLYGFWPALTGTTEDERAAPEAKAPASATPVEVVVAQRQPFPLRTEASGHLVPWQRVVLTAEAAGRIERRLVEEGDRVAQGQLLVQLDDREARIALAEAEAELVQAQATYAVDAKPPPAVAARDTARLARARARFEDALDAFRAGTLPADSLQEARRRYDAALVLAGRKRKAVQAATSGLSAAEQRVARARLSLSRTRIEAPFAGRVADLLVEVGQRVTSGREVLTLLDDRRMKVEVDVLETDLVRVERGATALVHVPALAAPTPDADAPSEAAARTPQPRAAADDDEGAPDAVFEGRVFAVNPQIDPERGTGRVTVALPNPDGRLVAGLFADVRLETARLDDRLVVPARAVLVRQGRDLVFVVEGGRAQWTYVTTGARSGNRVAVTRGLSPGDTVAVAGHFALAHDAPVTVREVRTLARAGE